MKIAYCSDLHLEFGKISLKNNDYDLLILAGDIFVAPLMYDDSVNYEVYRKMFDKFFEEVSNNFPMTFIVIGNHEYYGGNFYRVGEFIYNYFSVFDNIRLFQNEFFIYMGKGFYGGTLWFNVDNPVYENYIENRMNDYACIRYHDRLLKVMDLRKHYHRFVNNLKMFIKDVDLVFSHHAPIMRSIHYDIDRGDILNLAYCNNLDELIIDNPNIKYWIHGHTHNHFNYKLNETSILCNPRGYELLEEISTKFNLKHIYL